MPLQTIRVTPADRKNGNKAKRDDAKPCPPPPACAPSPMEDEDESPEAISSRRRSSSSVGGAGGDICRICHCEAGPDLPLISPCWCSGSLRFVHQQCLQQWIKSSDARCCELCKFQFVMRTTLKPFRKWEKLEMSSVERRKVLCSMAFHAVAVTCVVWSLWVLIERTAEEVRNGALEWPFWTKLVVVGVGFTGGLVFMYVQCKMYAQLFRRWRAYNRIIQVQDAPDKQHSQAVFSAAAHQTADVLTSAADEETKRQVSPDEDELFHSCESGRSSSNSSSSSDDGERRRQQLRGDEDEGRLQAVTAETGSNKTTLTSVTDTNPPLGEVVVVLPPGGGGGERRHDS